MTKTPNWGNIPDELCFDLLFLRLCLIIHQLVYLYFLCFLCNKRLKKMDNALAALKQLEYFSPNICKNGGTPEAHLILGILYEEVECFDEAVYPYDVSFSLRLFFTSALCRSYLVLSNCAVQKWIMTSTDYSQPCCHIMFASDQYIAL